MVPSPNWPKLFLPHDQTVPSLFSAKVWAPSLAEMAATPVRPLTCTGELLSAVPPLPNYPSMPLPHAHTVPSLLSATVWT